MPTITRYSIIPKGEPLPKIGGKIWKQFNNIYYVYQIISIEGVEWTEQLDIKATYQVELEEKRQFHPIEQE